MPGDASSGTGCVRPRRSGSQLGRGVHRAGTEVLVDFVDGDIDRPIIVGQLLAAGTTYLGQPVKTAVPTTLVRSRAGTCPTWTAAAPPVVGGRQPEASCACAWPPGSRGGWSELSLGHIIAHSGNSGAGHANAARLAGRGSTTHRRLGHRARRPRPAAQHYRPHGTRCQRAKRRWTPPGCGSTQSRPATGPSLEPKRTTTRRPSPARLRCPTKPCNAIPMPCARKPKANTAAVSAGKKLKKPRVAPWPTP